MEKQELTRLTTIDDLIAAYQEVMGDRIHTDGTHPLHTKGVIDGLEVMVTAIAKTMAKTKKLPDEGGVSDK